MVSDGAHESAEETQSIEVHAGVVMTPASSGGTDYYFGFTTVDSPGVVEMFTLTNNETVSVTALSVTPPTGSEFAFEGETYPGTGGTCADTLGPGQTCTIAIRYTPTIAGSVEDDISINFTAARGPVRYAFTLSGYGT